MKRLFSLLTILLFPFFAFTQEEKIIEKNKIGTDFFQNSQSKEEGAFAESAVEEDLQLNLTEGVLYTLSYQTEIESFLGLPGFISNQKEILQIEYGVKLIRQEEKKLRFQLYILNISIPSLVWEEYAESSLQKEFLAFWKNHSNDLLYSFEEPFLDMLLSSQGGLLELSGYERFKNQSFQILKDRMDWSDRHSFVENFFAFLFKSIERQWQSLYFFHPQKKVSVGSRWESEILGTMGSSLRYHFCFERSDEKNIFISVSGDCRIPSLKESFGVEGVGWIQGYLVLDKNSGWILGGSLQAHLDQQEIIAMGGIQSFLKVKLVEFRRH